MAIRGGGDKVIIVNCNITATGGDTLSLWNTNGGRYYHSGCYFEGYVDYVCPRGYCYISNSEFYGHNGNASIWHDGEGGKDHKLVVKNSNFDGVSTGFGLGRCHRVSAFYLLDCNFTANMRDNGGINYAGDSTTQDRDKLLYGLRTYFDRCNRETGDYDWHNNNLSTAENSPARDAITDAWTFNNTWNPEKEIHGLLNCAFLPVPGYYAKKVDSKPILSWLPGKDAVAHLIYFGTNKTPEFVANQTDTTYSIPNKLNGASRYYWHVDEILSNGDTIKGSLWTFTTNVTAVPAQAFNPYPPVDTNLTRYTISFSWSANAAEVDSFFVYFGSQEKLDLLSKQKGVTYTISGLAADSVYFWRVDSKNEFGTTQGELWRFNFKIKQSSGILNGSDGNEFQGIFPNPASEALTINYALKEQGEVIISICDIQGRIIYNKNLGIQQATNLKYDIQVSELQLTKKGSYFMQITSGSRIETFPFIIM